MTEPQVVVAESATALADDVAARLIALLAEIVSDGGSAHLAVTGGSILEQVFAALAAADSSAVAWERVHLWWGDERFVAPDSPDRNDRAAMAAGLGSLGLDAADVHAMPAVIQHYGDDPEFAAASYAGQLRAAAPDEALLRLDVVLLGIGPDGHCASLFPHHLALDCDDLVIAVHNSPKPPPTRITLGYRTLNAARHVWFIASGESKADAVRKALSGADFHETPSARPRGTESTLWLIDQQAASHLPH